MLVKRVPQPQKKTFMQRQFVLQIWDMRQYRFLHLRKEMTTTGAIVERDV